MPRKKRHHNLKYKPEFCQQAEIVCREGFTDAKLASLFGVNRSQIHTWKTKYPEFGSAVQRGKDFYDSEVAEKSLKKLIKGFFYWETEYRIDKNGNKVLSKKVRKYFVPQLGAICRWQNNRSTPERPWRDKVEHEHSGVVVLKPGKVNKPRGSGKGD